jgi:hypothetical protein
MIRFVLEQFAARGQLVSAHFCNVFDLSAAVGEGGGLVKSQSVHGDNLRGGAERDAVPAKESRDLQVARRGEEADED